LDWAAYINHLRIEWGNGYKAALSSPIKDHSIEREFDEFVSNLDRWNIIDQIRIKVQAEANNIESLIGSGNVSSRSGKSYNMGYQTAINKILELLKDAQNAKVCDATKAKSLSEPLAKNNLTPLQLATLFHDKYETLAPTYGYETREETRNFNPESNNGKLMVQVCREILNHLTMIDWKASHQK
jgi:hypothetical protein